jgi:hypothetical protein
MLRFNPSTRLTIPTTDVIPITMPRIVSPPRILWARKLSRASFRISEYQSAKPGRFMSLVP